MFSSLRMRLVLSYVFILIVTLVVIGVTLLFVLRSRPVSTDEITARLAYQLQVVTTRRDWQTLPQERLSRLLELPLKIRQLGARTLITDAKGLISYDSLHQVKTGTKIDINPKPYTDSVVETANFFRGTWTDSSGLDWLLVAYYNDSTATGTALMLAARAPHVLSIPEIAQYYGDDILFPLLEAGAIGLLVAFVMSLIIARSVTGALHDMALTASAIAEGHTEEQVAVRGPAEVRTVAEAFNRMTTEVEATQKAQRDFLANVTHDLRTPLTSIQGFSQAIIEGVASDPSAAQRAAQIIHDEAGRLNRMVQELLDLARIEAGRMTMMRHSVRLDEILNAVGERLKMKAASKNVSFSADIPPLPAVAGDGDRLVQVYTNLIDNAIKHTPEGGHVSLFAAPKDGGVLTQVKDTGEGIPEADVPRVFDRFYQVDKSRQSSQREGAGLGLTITKQIVEAHGGKIWVESTENIGSVFSVWFPVLTSDSTTIIRRRPASKPPGPRPSPDR